MKKVYAIRMTEAQEKQIAELEKLGFGNRTAIITMAVDRMYQSETTIKEKKMDYTYQYIEDNVGGLHMFIFNANDKVITGITNLEYAVPGEWHSVKDNLTRDALDAISGWDGHMEDYDIDPVKFYQVLCDDSQSNVVADNGMLYPERMGRAARIYFGIDNK